MPKSYSETSPNNQEEKDNSGNEVMVTTVLEATSPLKVLMTPILVKIVQEVTEAINGYVSVDRLLCLLSRLC